MEPRSGGGPLVLLLLLLLLVAISAMLPSAEAASKNRAPKKRVLLDKTPVLPGKVRLLAECHGANCTRTCPQNYAMDSRQQYCRRKRQDACPQGYMRRANGGCVIEEVHCPPGSTREGSRCIIRSSSCPAGYVARGNQCVRESICQPGFRWENGLCFPSGARIFCPPGFTEQRGGTCAPAACADCCDCQDETVAPGCPAGFRLGQWGRCVRLMQASPDLRINAVMYKLPVECRSGAHYNEGRCEEWSGIGRPACRSGHLYNGTCVEVAKCTRGTLNNVCSCEFEQHLTPTCTVGKLQEVAELPGTCIISKVHCRHPSRLQDGVCVRESKTRPTCTEGVPYEREYCAVDIPRCPDGLELDSHGLCRRGNESCRFDCGGYQRFERWCGRPAVCPDGYKLNEYGYCVAESIHPANVCPSGTVERGGRCIHTPALCRTGYRYDPDLDVCIRCDERPVHCPRGDLNDEGTLCKWSEPACLAGYSWIQDGMCVMNASRTYRCRRGYEQNGLCVHEELSCPHGYELLGENCVVREEVHCPEGSYALDGRCTVAKECPENYQASMETCVREDRRLINFTLVTCPDGYEYDGEVCMRSVVVEATTHRKHAHCPEGYDRSEAGCVRKIRTFAVCPPRTIYTDRNDRCYCEVDLMCPHGYERTGTDCTFRAVGYSPFVNFLNPCYGSSCGSMYCLSQCHNPPCPLEPCAEPAPGIALQYGPPRCLGGIGGHGSADCPPQEVIGLVCPPGYERVNSSCLAYYDKCCPEGFEPEHGRPEAGCVREIVVNPVCPPGYMNHPDHGCMIMSCPAGYKLTVGMVCEKRELRSPKACPHGWDYFRGACYRRTLCRNGTIEGPYCVEREFTRPFCPPGYVQRVEDCAKEGSCRPDSIYIDGACTRFIDPVPCPSGTYRVGRLCVYPDPPVCEDIPFAVTNCTGEVDSSGRCWWSVAPSCPPGYRMRNDRCAVCLTERPSCPEEMTIRDGLCLAERVVCNEGYFLRGSYCVKLLVARPRCPSDSLDYSLCNGFCIVPRAPECTGPRYEPPTCARGFLFKGKCVQYGRCEADYTLLDGECHLRRYTDPSCHGKGTRVGDLCIGGTPQCPPNYALMGGRCYSCLMENAQCSSGAVCADSFCQLDPPRCASPGSIFDGRVCRKLITSNPSCPAGTSPDRHDANFCQLKSERAVYNCPAEYHYQNGVCLKKMYQTVSCPEGYKLRQGVCVKRICTRQASGAACTNGPALPWLSCTNCFNGTAPAQRDEEIHSHDLCCTVFSPRKCARSGGCYHERETACGSFCFTEEDKIHLMVTQAIQMDENVYLPPRWSDEDEDSDYEDHTDMIPLPGDCGQCLLGPASCPQHCNTYDCQNEEEECHFVDALKFCVQQDSLRMCYDIKKWSNMYNP